MFIEYMMIRLTLVTHSARLNENKKPFINMYNLFFYSYISVLPLELDNNILKDFLALCLIVLSSWH